MVKGTTKSGIKFQIDERVKDDMRLLRIFTKMQNPDTTPEEASKLVMKAIDFIFGGEAGTDAFMDAVAGANGGICEAETMIRELKEILEACKLKNSSASHKSSTRARKN